jgi:hypothetical protein
VIRLVAQVAQAPDRTFKPLLVPVRLIHPAKELTLLKPDAVGGATAPAVTAGGKGFIVEGSDQFQNVGAALGRSCDIQHNKCADIANSAAGKSSGLSVGQCDQQDSECRAATQN